MDLDSWGGSAVLDTPAGSLLRKLVAALPSDRDFEIAVFGSAPIQMFIDAALNSSDVDLFSDDEDLEEHVQRAQLGQNQTEYCIQVCSELNFRTSPRYSRDAVRSNWDAALSIFRTRSIF